MDGARTPRRVRARARARARSAGRRRPSAGRERTEGRVAVGSSRTPPVVGRGASSSDESAIVCAHGGGKKVRSRQSARSRDPSAGFQTRWSAGTSSRWRCTRLPVARAAGLRWRRVLPPHTRRQHAADTPLQSGRVRGVRAKPQAHAQHLPPRVGGGAAGPARSRAPALSHLPGSPSRSS